jgi:hypothetical protein
MTRAAFIAAAMLVLAFGIAAANPAGTNVVINEIYPNPPGTYDGAEFIELYNPTASPIDISGWVLCGTEYDQLCGGEDLWQFPASTTIAAGGFIIVTKDGHDGDDGFYENFGFDPDFEMFDKSFYADNDSPEVDNMIIVADDPATNYSDEIQLVGGRGYGVICGGTSNEDVVYLYTSPSLTTLVDLVEYKDPDLCASDPCPGDDGSNDNAFPLIPYLGNTLGRNALSDDTDNSDSDFALQVPTPGQTNSENTPPWINDVVYSPIPPNSSHTTDISAMVTDDSGIDSVMVYYNPDETSWHRVMATPSGDIYTASIPIQPDGSQVAYYVRAVDDQAAGMNYPAEGMSGPYHYSVGYTSIYDIQFVPSGGDASPLAGQAVNVRGIVTSAMGNYAAGSFWIHEGTGAFKGIQIYAPQYAGEINEGDDVTVCGNVSEYYNMTEVNLHFAAALVVHSTGNANYGYTNVTTAQIAPANVNAEAYESQLVRVLNATVTGLPDTYGEWLFRDSSGTDAKADDYAYYSYEPKVLDALAELRGIFMFSFLEYKIEPRYDADIIGPPRIAALTYSPIPPTAGQNVTVSAVCTDNSDIASATLSWSYSPAGPWTNVAMSQVARDVSETWAATVGPFADDSRVFYYVQCTDNNTPTAMTARKPSTGSYSFYVGISSIHDVQYVPPGGDISPMDSLAVNVEGYVTAEPGVYNANSFYIADASGAWNGILVYDRTGTLHFNRGDYVVCCGEVDEYFGQTELALHFPEAAALATPPREEISPTSISTAMLQNVVSAEQYESVYVYAEDCAVYDTDVGYGEWAISNGAASDTCRVGNYATYDYVPVVSDNVYVKGLVAYSFGNYKIEPRGNPDIAANPVGISGDQFGGKFGLAQNMPNPFNPKTTIAFNLPQAADVRLEVYDVAGRRVATLINRNLAAGPHEVVWNGLADGGEHVASGVYFYRLAAGDRELSRKMVLLK